MNDEIFYYVYILYSESYDKYYIGQTKSLEKRVDEHNNSNYTSFTKKYRPWKLNYFYVVKSRRSSLSLEKYLKHRSKEFIKRACTDLELQTYIIDNVIKDC